MIYLASPYTGSAIAETNRAIAVRSFVEDMLWEGLPVFSPIVYTAAFPDFPGHFEAWQFLNDTAIANCTELWVLCLPGWEASRGVTHEIALARQLGKTVRYFTEEGDQFDVGG